MAIPCDGTFWCKPQCARALSPSQVLREDKHHLVIGLKPVTDCVISAAGGSLFSGWFC